MGKYFKQKLYNLLRCEHGNEPTGSMKGGEFLD